MKKTVTTICVCIIGLVFVFMFIFCMFFQRTTSSDYVYQYQWPEFSIQSLSDGQYFKGITNYFSDTIHGRDRFIDFESKIRALYGLSEEEVVIDRNPINVSEDESSQIISGAYSEDFFESSAEISDIVSTDNESSQHESGSDTSSSEPIQEDAELCGTIILLGDRAMEVFYGNEKNSIRFSEILNDFSEKIDENINIYSMVVPKASAFYIQYAKQTQYSSTAGNNKECIEIINNNLSERIIPVDAYGALEKHTSEEIYFRTDHHWTALAAYYASLEFSKTAGLPFDDISCFDAVVREGYVGTMYKYSNYSPVLLNNPENLVSYIPTATYTATYYNRADFTSPKTNEGGLFWDIPEEKRSSWYSTFIRGDRYAVKVESDVCNNGRKLLIVKDSYGNPLSQYLLQSFEEIYVVDAREYKLSLKDTIDKYEITDVLFVECTFSAVGGQYLDYLKELCK